eukprot:TRINITY_DN104548_c0_g1_i1.p1 TRINITY_DN104548_c0_g1~~TRINITY_DN104548_c0_g1_i1.p1  ORF type:complete len:274 (-),score=16.32 TRINITY_DN104548_c0_g1_i1:527-1348(-)
MPIPKPVTVQVPFKLSESKKHQPRTAKVAPSGFPPVTFGKEERFSYIPKANSTPAIGATGRLFSSFKAKPGMTPAFAKPHKTRWLPKEYHTPGPANYSCPSAGRVTGRVSSAPPRRTPPSIGTSPRWTTEVCTTPGPGKYNGTFDRFEKSSHRRSNKPILGGGMKERTCLHGSINQDVWIKTQGSVSDVNGPGAYEPAASSFDITKRCHNAHFKAAVAARAASAASSRTSKTTTPPVPVAASPTSSVRIVGDEPACPMLSQYDYAGLSDSDSD